MGGVLSLAAHRLPNRNRLTNKQDKLTLGPRGDETAAIFVKIINDLASDGFDALLSRNINLKGCVLDFSNIQISKCFPSVGVSGQVDPGGRVVKIIEESLCYAECYSSPIVEARWAVCKISSTECPPHYCHDKCAESLISWSVHVNNITGCDKVNITSIEYQGVTLTPSTTKYHVNLKVAFEFPQTIVANATASLGGMLSLVPGLAGVPTTYNLSAALSNVKFTAIVSINILCNNTTDTAEYTDISVSNISMVQESLNFNINSASLNPLVRVFESLATLILDALRSEWILLIQSYVIPMIGGVLNSAVTSATKLKGISIPSSGCYNVV